MKKEGMTMTYSEKILEALENEEWIEAQQLLAKALYTDDAETLIELGEALQSLGFLDEAKQVFEHLVTLFPELKGLNIPLAEIAIENNKIDEAFELLEEIDNKDDSYIERLLVTADLYQVLNMPEVSEAKLKEAQKLAPDNSLLLFALGELYFVTSQFTQAIDAYHSLLDENIQTIANVSINERLGNSYSHLGAFEVAVPYLEKALVEGETDDRLFQLAFTYLQLHENQKAIPLLQKLREVNAHYQSLYLYLAEALQEEEQIAEAQEVIEAGIKEDTYQVAFYHFASENAYRLHDVAKAEGYLKQALTIDEQQDDTLLTLSNLYLSEERYEEVIATLEKLEDKDHPYRAWNLAHAYNELEEYQAANLNYQQAYQELAHEPDFLKEYALFLREDGQTAKAKEVLQQYLHYAPDDLEMTNLADND